MNSDSLARSEPTGFVALAGDRKAQTRNRRALLRTLEKMRQESLANVQRLVEITTELEVEGIKGTIARAPLAEAFRLGVSLARFSNTDDRLVTAIHSLIGAPGDYIAGQVIERGQPLESALQDREARRAADGKIIDLAARRDRALKRDRSLEELSADVWDAVRANGSAPSGSTVAPRVPKSEGVIDLGAYRRERMTPEERFEQDREQHAAAYRARAAAFFKLSEDEVAKMSPEEIFWKYDAGIDNLLRKLWPDA